MRGWAGSSVEIQDTGRMVCVCRRRGNGVDGWVDGGNVVLVT